MNQEKLRNTLKCIRLPAWELIPDFGLYMDQLLTYADRVLPRDSGFPGLTCAMINNYVKSGLIDKPAGKKYSRDAIAQLLIVCLLKQTLSQDSIRSLLHPAEGIPAEKTYQDFRSALDALTEKYTVSAPASPLSNALEASCLHLICRLQLADASEKAPS